jgi:chromosome segregation ATPase
MPKTRDRKGIAAAIGGLWQRRRRQQAEPAPGAVAPAQEHSQATAWEQLLEDHQTLAKELAQLRSVLTSVRAQQIEADSALEDERATRATMERAVQERDAAAQRIRELEQALRSLRADLATFDDALDEARRERDEANWYLGEARAELQALRASAALQQPQR